MFAGKTQTELDNILTAVPVTIPIVIDPSGATENLSVDVENRKIHVALPTGGRYQIKRNGLMIYVK